MDNLKFSEEFFLKDLAFSFSGRDLSVSAPGVVPFYGTQRSLRPSCVLVTWNLCNSDPCTVICDLKTNCFFVEFNIVSFFIYVEVRTGQGYGFVANKDAVSKGLFCYRTKRIGDRVAKV